MTYKIILNGEQIGALCEDYTTALFTALPFIGGWFK